MIRVCAVTGTRAEYGVMHRTLDIIRKNPKLDLVLVVTGMHLSKLHGNTISEIRKDGFKIGAVVDAHIKKMDNYEMAKSVGYCLIGMAESFRKIKPDIVMIVGDRGEMLAAAIAAAHMNIPIVHISGGDISGSIDDSIRSAITQFAHVHLANTPRSANRLLKMGEQAWRIKMVGSLGLEKKFEKIVSPKKIAKDFRFDLKKPILLVVQHPVTEESKYAGLQMKNTLDAIVRLKQQIVVIYPNADAGGRDMINVIEKYRKYDFIRIIKTLPRKTFLGLISLATVMIGNSSAGLVETPTFNLIAINVGTRQKGRERGSNVIDVGYDSKEIYNAVKKILSQRARCKSKKFKSAYKDYNTSKKILNILLKLKIDQKLLNKHSG